MSFGRATLSERSRAVWSGQTTTALARTASLLRHIPLRHRHLSPSPCSLLAHETLVPTTLPTNAVAAGARAANAASGVHRALVGQAEPGYRSTRTFRHGWRTTATTATRVRNLSPHPRHSVIAMRNNVSLCRDRKRVYEPLFHSILFD